MIYIKSKLKLIVVIAIICVITIIGSMIYNINSKYPNREIKPIYWENVINIDDLEVKLKEIHVYKYEELSNIVQNKVDLDENDQIMFNSFYDYSCIVLELEITNNLDKNIKLNAMEKFCKFTLEVKDYCNNGDKVLFKLINNNYDGVVEQKTTEFIKVPVLIKNKYISFEELQSAEIRLVYSYYPEKCYFVNKESD